LAKARLRGLLDRVNNPLSVVGTSVVVAGERANAEARTKLHKVDSFAAWQVQARVGDGADLAAELGGDRGRRELGGVEVEADERGGGVCGHVDLVGS